MIDKKQLFALYKDAFPYDSDDYIRYFFSSVRKENIVVVKRGGRIVSAGYLVPKNAVIFGKSIVVDYLSAVGTLSDLRGHGIAAKVIALALKKAYKSKVPLVALNPFNFEYYKRYCFVDASYCGKDLICGGYDYDITYADSSVFGKLAEIYEEYSSGFSFKEAVGEQYYQSLTDELAVDDEHVWAASDNGEIFAYIAIDNGEITKYATVDFDKFKSINALKGMSFYDFKANELAYTQMRIANVGEFLKLPIYSDLSFEHEFAVFDNIIGKNSGTYRVKYVDGEAVVRRVSKSLRNAISVADLAQSFFNGQYPFKKPNVLFMDKY